MFDKNYKETMDDVTVDRETYDKILDKIILKEELKDRKNPAIPWRVAFACVACVAIVLGVMFVPRDRFKPVIKDDTPATQTLKVSKSYDEIYKLIKPKKEFSFWNGFGATDDQEAIVYEEMEYADGNSATNGIVSAPSSTDGSNSSAKPGALKDENTSANNSDKSENDDFSTTTEQVEGVAEADIVKTDGKYIYYIKGTTFSIFSAEGAASKLISKTELSREYTTDYGDMFLKDDRVIILQPDHLNGNGSYVSILIYDISDPAVPKEVAVTRQEGWYNSSRMVGDYIYLISNYSVNAGSIDKNEPATFVPTTEINGVCEAVPADKIYYYGGCNPQSRYTVVGAFNYKDGTLSDTASLLGGTDQIYCSKGNIILANSQENHAEDYPEDEAYPTLKTVVSRLAIEKGKIEYKTTGEVAGTLDNQFYIDEYNGYFRFVTTVNLARAVKKEFENSEDAVVHIIQEFDSTAAQLTILDSELKKVGEIGNLARGERVYSVRFMGDTAYFVTFRQTDPLFSADLSDPHNPKILGELKIPGFSEYMYPYGNGLLLGFGMDADESTGRTKDLKLSMFNITDPANVTEQDKTIIDGYEYSPALYNHKAMLVHKDKNLIGFAATDDYSNSKYIIFKYTDEGFVRTATLTVESDYKYAMDDVRGLFVGDEFYVVSKNALQVFDINTFLQINLVEF